MKKFTFSTVGKEKSRKARAEFSALVTFASVQASDNGERILHGKAIVYDQLSDDRGDYQVKIAKGAATFADPTFAYLNHNPDSLIGSTANGSLKLSEAGDGVDVTISLPNTVDGDRAWEWVKTKLVTGLSFGCWPLEWTDVETAANPDAGTPYSCVTTFTKMLVDEITLTPRPSFANATISIAGTADAAAEPEADATTDEPAADAADNFSSLISVMRHRLRLTELQNA